MKDRIMIKMFLATLALLFTVGACKADIATYAELEHWTVIKLLRTGDCTAFRSATPTSELLIHVDGKVVNFGVTNPVYQEIETESIILQSEEIAVTPEKINDVFWYRIDDPEPLANVIVYGNLNLSKRGFFKIPDSMLVFESLTSCLHSKG
jgi:hypothetical protein